MSAGRWWQDTEQSAQPAWVASTVTMDPRVNQINAQIKLYLSIPKVDDIERNIIRLQFSDDVNKEVLRQYARPVTLPENETTERLRARYGSELTVQMLQLQNALLEASLAAFTDDFWREAKAAESDSRFMVYADAIGNGSVGEYTPGRQVLQFSLRLFSDWYMSTHDSPAIRLYNRIAERYSPGTPDGANAQSNIWTLNLQQPDELIDPNLVSYSPVWGFYTFRENLKFPKPDWLETAIPMVIISFMAWYAAPYAAAAVGASGNVIVTAGFAAAFATAGTSLLTTGNIKFKDVLRSAITAMLTAGFAQQTGLDRLGYELPDGSIQYINGVPVVQNYLLRGMAVLGTSTFRGLLSEITGGRFGPAFRQGLADGLAREVLNSINVQINQQTGLSDFERSSYQMFGRAFSAAIRAASDPNDPAHAFAVDFLNQVVTSLPDTPAINLPPPGTTNRVAFDDEGYLMPGIVDFSSPPAQQRQQLYNQLIQQGLSPQAAQNLTQHYFTFGNVSGVSRPDLPQGGSTTPPVNRVAFDDEGNLMPGIVDPNASPEAQRQQLQDHLIRQGLPRELAGLLAMDAALPVGMAGQVAIRPEERASVVELFGDTAPAPSGATGSQAPGTVPVGEVFSVNNLMAMPTWTFDGAGTATLSDAMSRLGGYRDPDTSMWQPNDQETISAGIDGLVQASGMSYERANEQYARFQQMMLQREDRLIDAGQRSVPFNERSSTETRVPLLANGTTGGLPNNTSHMGSNAQLRFGRLVGDVMGLDPVFGALLSPTGGIVGAGNVRITSPTLINLAGGAEVLTNHGTAHDAAGYLLNYHRLGPGYQYVPGQSGLISTTSPLGGQVTGINFYYNLRTYGQPTQPIDPYGGP